MICRRLIAKRLYSLKFKQPVRSLKTKFYNDDLVVQRPFNNVVVVSFPGHDRIPFISQAQFKDVFQQKYGPVRAAHVTLPSIAGYISFESEESKAEALNSPPDRSLPFNYLITDYFHQDSCENKFPFSAMTVAAYRPSVHEVGRIMLRFLEYGNVNGTQIIPCPYDSDRAFLYCSYLQGKEMHAACEALSTIPGSSVAQHPNSTSCPEDVHVWKFGDVEFRRYGRGVYLTCERHLTDLLVAEILRFAEQYGEIEETRFIKSACGLFIRFKYPAAVFKLFYEKGFFGRVRRTLNESGKNIYLNTAAVSTKTQHAYAIKFSNLVKCEENPLTYLSRLLDLVGCNPGIVNVYHDDVANTAWANMPLPWYVRDVSCKVHQFLSSENVPEEYKGVEVGLFSPYWPCEYIDKVANCEDLPIIDDRVGNCEDLPIEEKLNQDCEHQDDESQILTSGI